MQYPIIKHKTTIHDNVELKDRCCFYIFQLSNQPIEEEGYENHQTIKDLAS
jgi:hypothetical protein